uniref:DUF4283 domain-containing protein n=1 Tax=Cannabis sativa TaxID=3483 RepID=A0A803P5J8_CANSA
MADSGSVRNGLEEVILDEEETGGVLIGDNGGSVEVEYDSRWFLVGSFLSGGLVDFFSMQQTMAALWIPGKGVYIKELGANFVSFQFYHEIYIKRVMDGSPRYFNRKALIAHRLRHGENPKNVPLNKIDLWLFDTPETDIAKPYGIFMKALYRKQSKLIGAQWLRSGIDDGECSGQPQAGFNGGRSAVVEMTVVYSVELDLIQMSEAEVANEGNNLGQGIRITDTKRRCTAGSTGMGSVVDLEDDVVEKRAHHDCMEHDISLMNIENGHSGGLALFWKEKDQAKLRGFSKNYIDIEVSVDNFGTWHLTEIYGEPNRIQRMKTWELLTTMGMDSNMPWCVMGDLNNVVAQEDKRGGAPYPQWLIDGFNQAL